MGALTTRNDTIVPTVGIGIGIAIAIALRVKSRKAPDFPWPLGSLKRPISDCDGDADGDTDKNKPAIDNRHSTMILW
jgi:hypothetical protein